MKNSVLASSRPQAGATLAAALLIAMATASTASAGVIRHDRSDQLYRDLGASASYESVGSISGATPGFNFFASAVLIAPNWALTAAHVVDNATSLSFTIGGDTFAGTSWVAHKKWDGSLGKGYDIGLIQFADDISAATGMTAAELYTGSSEVGNAATAVGFGMTGTGATGATTFDGAKRAGLNMIDALLLTPGKSNRILLSDFDNPDNASDSSWGSDTPLDLEYLIAPGDSGGGLFADIGGTDYLIGVHSFGWGRLDGNPDSDYGDASGHTRVSSFTGWIDDILNPSTGGKGGGGKGSGGNNGGGKPFETFSHTVPEPTTLAVFGVGLVGLGDMRRRRAA